MGHVIGSPRLVEVGSSIDSSVDSGWSYGLNIYGCHELSTLLAHNQIVLSDLFCDANQKKF